MELKSIKEDKFLVGWVWDRNGNPHASTCLCEGFNIVVKNDNYDESLLVLFNGEDINFVPPETDMWDLLVWTGAFDSKSQARKNWTKTAKEIPPGWNEFLVGKNKAHKTGIYVLNPIKVDSIDEV